MEAQAVATTAAEISTGSAAAPPAEQQERGEAAAADSSKRKDGERKGSGTKRPNRWGGRGGKKNPNVKWHCEQNRARQEGRLQEFLRNNPKPEKKELDPQADTIDKK